MAVTYPLPLKEYYKLSYDEKNEYSLLKMETLGVVPTILAEGVTYPTTYRTYTNYSTSQKRIYRAYSKAYKTEHSIVNKLQRHKPKPKPLRQVYKTDKEMAKILSEMTQCTTMEAEFWMDAIFEYIYRELISERSFNLRKIGVLTPVISKKDLEDTIYGETVNWTRVTYKLVFEMKELFKQTYLSQFPYPFHKKFGRLQPEPESVKEEPDVSEGFEGEYFDDEYEENDDALDEDFEDEDDLA